jgi:hypothetical protein
MLDHSLEIVKASEQDINVSRTIPDLIAAKRSLHGNQERVKSDPLLPRYLPVGTPDPH